MRIKALPNLLTMVRMLLIPLFIVAFTRGRMGVCALIFVVSGFTDVADGFIARHFSCESNLGKILDPIADKLTYATVFFCLCSVGRLPVFFAVGFTVLQVLQGIGALFVYKSKRTVVKSNIPGKIAGFAMFILSFVNLVFYDRLNNVLITNNICLVVLAIIACASTVYFIQYIGSDHPAAKTNN